LHIFLLLTATAEPTHPNPPVFVDNYLDGGYHVPIAHPELAGGLDEGSYTVELADAGLGCIQRANGADASRAGAAGAAAQAAAAQAERLGGKSLYLFAHPHFMVNRYGPWMDTNTVIPTSPSSCVVVFDYYLDQEAPEVQAALTAEAAAGAAAPPTEVQTTGQAGAAGAADPGVADPGAGAARAAALARYVERSLAASERVQREDEHLCRLVQAGLSSRGAYTAGRYAPQLELGMHQFHGQLHRDLVRGRGPRAKW
jgi:choline monooxygenase